MATLAKQKRQFEVSALPVARQLDLTVVLQGITVYLICLLVLLIIIFSTEAFFSTDDYYHARISEEMVVQGTLRLDFPWLPLTILSPEKYYDHHLLYHMALAYPVYFFDMTGAKVMTAMLAAGIFVSAWALFRQIGVNYPILWTIGLFGVGSTFLFRMLMIRTQGFSMFLLIVGLIFLFNRRWRWMILWGFLYTWLYNGFVLMPVMAVVYAGACWLEDRRIEWKPVVYTCLGVIAGLIINPYFPENIVFIFSHLGAKVDIEGSVPLGQEWSPFNTRTILRSFGLTVLCMVSAFAKLLFSLSPRRTDDAQPQRPAIDVPEVTLLVMAILTGYMAFNSMRFFEYFPGFALLYAAAAWGRQPVFEVGYPLWDRVKRFVVPAALTVGLLYFAVTTAYQTWDMGRGTRDPLDYAGASNWLEQNTAPGTMVYAVGFNDFSRMFFYNQQNYYLIGLDPTYLLYEHPDLYEAYRNVNEGRVERPSEALVNTFNIQYVVSGRRHSAFNRVAVEDPNLEMVFRDEFNYVWRVRDEAFATAATEADQAQ